MVILEWPHGLAATIEAGLVTRVSPPEFGPMLREVLGWYSYSPADGDPDVGAANFVLDVITGGYILHATVEPPVVGGVP